MPVITDLTYVQTAKKMSILADQVRIQARGLRRDRVRILALALAATVHAPVTSRVNMQLPGNCCQLIIREVIEVSANEFIRIGHL